MTPATWLMNKILSHEECFSAGGENVTGRALTWGFA
jgi:hypothetical protein